MAASPVTRYTRRRGATNKSVATSPELPEFLTPPEVATLLRCSVKTLANWRSLGIGPPSVKPAGRVLYPGLALAAWIAGAPGRANGMGQRAGDAFRTTGMPSRNQFDAAGLDDLAALWRRGYFEAMRPPPGD